MGQANFPGLGFRSAAYQGGQRGAVMRGAEGPLRRDAPAAPERPRDGMHLGDLQGLPKGQLGHNAGHSLGQHGFPAARGTDQKQVMPSCRGDLRRPLGPLLAPDLGKVRARPGWRGFPLPPLHRRMRRRLLQQGSRLLQGPYRIGVDPFQVGGFSRIFHWQHNVGHAMGPGADQHGQDPVDPPYPAV